MMTMKTVRIEMRVDLEWIVRIDEWRRRQAVIPTRSEAVRRLVERTLETEGVPPPEPGRPR